MEKINIAKLLKDCPEGMELDCPLFENLEFDHILEYKSPYPIVCRVKTELGGYNVHSFTEYGCYSPEKYAKCVIFPKGKTTWEGFQRPFKDGDIVFYNNYVGIFKKWIDETTFRNYDHDIQNAVYGCACNKFERIDDPSEIEKTMKKYSLTREEFDEICSILEQVLYVGSCGWCI